jgi:hypothetical protein
MNPLSCPFFSVVKHRLPSPIRQAGDGMEETDKTLKSDQVLKSDSTPSLRRTGSQPEVKGQIRLPMTNISLDKLPPITDTKVRLPQASPSSPLVKVSIPILCLFESTVQFHEQETSFVTL